MARRARTGPQLTREQQLLRDFRLDGDTVIRVSTGREVNPKPDAHGYQHVKTAAGLDGERFQIRLHRLKVFLRDGVMPPEVDHSDADGGNNQGSNLRPATRAQNARNRKRQSNALEYRGVRKHGRKWLAALTIDGVVHRLGTFDTPQAASAVVEGIAELEHGEFYRCPAKR
ncbi:hypothetical protein [uncultured Methylobacterium sp.]|jgi:hypothetical protein|uniref:hypothetical protein n=1 Tax=uncultured Methylobacterium sp. TaxID=157278 RepID=UPI00261AF1A0|nr:hypothetical protein [uncultured Methylobacterium sp.]